MTYTSVKLHSRELKAELRPTAMTQPMARAEMWNARYTAAEYVYGTTPSAFLASHSALFSSGATALVLADGEGRNGVYLASLGVRVTSMDISSAGADKARRLAAERGVDLNITRGDILAYDWVPAAYDFVVAVFIQFLNASQRSRVFKGIRRTLKPGGRVLVHGYSVEQMRYESGGPRVLDHLYTEAFLADAFAGFEIVRLSRYDSVLKEGKGHAGVSALIDLVATKLPSDSEECIPS